MLLTGLMSGVSEVLADSSSSYAYSPQAFVFLSVRNGQIQTEEGMLELNMQSKKDYGHSERKSDYCRDAIKIVMKEFGVQI